MNLNFFTTIVGYTLLWENLISWRDKSPIESIEIFEDVSFRVILKDAGIEWQWLPFCWSWPWGLKRLEKKEEYIDFEIEVWGTCGTLALRVEKEFFLLFRDKKEKLLKTWRQLLCLGYWIL